MGVPLYSSKFFLALSIGAVLGDHLHRARHIATRGMMTWTFHAKALYVAPVLFARKVTMMHKRERTACCAQTSTGSM